MQSSQQACLYAGRMPGRERFIEPHCQDRSVTDSLAAALLRTWQLVTGTSPIPGPPRGRPQVQRRKAPPSYDQLERHYREVFAVWHKEWFGVELARPERAVILVNGARTTDGYEWHYMVLFVSNSGGRLYLAVPRFVHGQPDRSPLVFAVNAKGDDVDGFVDYLL